MLQRRMLQKLKSEPASPLRIGVFDSGVGGLSVLREIRQQLPDAHLTYVADAKYLPYGAQPPDVIRSRSLAITRFLVDRHAASVVVVACNTATTHAVEMLREQFADVPIVGMEPAVKPARQATKSGIVGVLATGSTLGSQRFAALIDRTADGIRVLTQPCPGLVEQVERGEVDSPVTVGLLTKYVTPLLERGADTLVLGCTHYPFLRPALQVLVGPAVAIIDTAAAVARQTARVAGAATRREPGMVTFVTSGAADSARPVIEQLWGAPVPEVLQLDQSV